MKKSIYVIAVLALSFFSCTEDNIIEKDAAQLDVEEQVRQLLSNSTACDNYKLVADGDGVGVVEVSFINDQIEFKITTAGHYYVFGTYLDLLDEDGEDFPVYSGGEPNIHEFDYIEFVGSDKKQMTITVDQDFFKGDYDFASCVMLYNKAKETKTVGWTLGSKFTPSSDAMFNNVDARKCLQ